MSDRINPFHYDIVILNRDGTTPRPLAIKTVSKYIQYPVVAADGKNVFFLAGVESNAGHRPIYSLWRVRADGGNPTQIADYDLFTSPLSWKPKP